MVYDGSCFEWCFERKHQKNFNLFQTSWHSFNLHTKAYRLLLYIKSHVCDKYLVSFIKSIYGFAPVAFLIAFLFKCIPQEGTQIPFPSMPFHLAAEGSEWAHSGRITQVAEGTTEISYCKLYFANCLQVDKDMMSVLKFYLCHFLSFLKSDQRLHSFLIISSVFCAFFQVHKTTPDRQLFPIGSMNSIKHGDQIFFIVLPNLISGRIVLMQYTWKWKHLSFHK